MGGYGNAALVQSFSDYPPLLGRGAQFYRSTTLSFFINAEIHCQSSSSLPMYRELCQMLVYTVLCWLI